MRKPYKRTERPDGPLLRVRTAVITETFNWSTSEWTETGVAPGTQWTVVQSGQGLEVFTTQPVLDVTDVPLRALLNRIIQMVKEQM